MLIHNIAPHTLLCDLPYHKTMKKYEDFEGMEVFFWITRGNSRFKHGSAIVHNISCLSLPLSAVQVHVIQERYWFSQINFFIEYFADRIKILFFSNQFYVIHMHK